MNERDLMDFINCESTDKEKMIEAVKEKLRWYTFEASEEEFDVEAVDALVRFLREAEPELGEAPETENDIQMPVQKKRLVKFSYGKIAAAVVIGVLALTLASVIVGNSLGHSLAWEDGGFFKGLQRDKEGQTMITSPEDLGMDLGIVEFYYELSEVPKEYQQYLVDPINVEGLEMADVELTLVHKTIAFQEIGTELLLEKEKKIECGVTIFENETRVIRDSYDEFQYQYSIKKEECTIDVHVKENTDKKIEYMVCMYDNNKKFFVSGEMEINDLVFILESYVYSILKK